MTPEGDTGVPVPSIPAALGTLLAALWERGGLPTARRNAWEAVRADQVRAAERTEANRALDALTARHMGSPR